jgi:hypothetical protein
MQTWLELPLPAASEEMAAPCRRLGAAFYQLCLQTKEDQGKASGKLQMVNFAQGGGHNCCCRGWNLLESLTLLRDLASGAMRARVLAFDLSLSVPTACCGYPPRRHDGGAAESTALGLLSNG